MADTLGELILRITGDVKGLEDALAKGNRALRASSKEAFEYGKTLSFAVSVPISAVGMAAVKAAGELEQMNVAFTTLVGGADKARIHLEDLKSFALKTPFEFTQLTLASKKLQALGFSAREVIPMLRDIGDAASALGLGGEGIDRIVLALGQMSAKGKVQAQEMRQLAEAGIPAWQMLADMLNVTVAKAMDMVEKRAVDAGTAVPALLAGMNKKFGGLMSLQMNTLLGQWSNFKDSLTYLLQDLGGILLPMLKPILEALRQMTLAVRDSVRTFNGMPRFVKNAAVSLLGFLALLGPTIVGLGALRSILAFVTYSFGALVAVPAIGTFFRSMIAGFTGVTIAAEAAAVGTAVAGGTMAVSLNVVIPIIVAATVAWVYMTRKALEFGDWVGRALKFVRQNLDLVKSEAETAANALGDYLIKLQELNATAAEKLKNLVDKAAAATVARMGEVAESGKKASEELDKAFSKFNLTNTRKELSEMASAFNLMMGGRSATGEPLGTRTVRVASPISIDQTFKTLSAGKKLFDDYYSSLAAKSDAFQAKVREESKLLDDQQKRVGKFLAPPIFKRAGTPSWRGAGDRALSMGPSILWAPTEPQKRAVQEYRTVITEVTATEEQLAKITEAYTAQLREHIRAVGIGSEEGKKYAAVLAKIEAVHLRALKTLFSRQKFIFPTADVDNQGFQPEALEKILVPTGPSATWIRTWKELIPDLQRGIDMMVSGARNLKTAMSLIGPMTISLAGAFASLGVTSSQELRKMADEALFAFKRIASDSSSTLMDRQRAEAEYLKRKIEYEYSAGIKITDAEMNRYKQLEKITGNYLQRQETMWRRQAHQVSLIVNDLAKDLSKLIFGGGNVDTRKLSQQAQAAKDAYDTIKTAAEEAVNSQADVMAAKARMEEADRKLAALSQYASIAARKRY